MQGHTCPPGWPDQEGRALVSTPLSARPCASANLPFSLTLQPPASSVCFAESLAPSTGEKLLQLEPHHNPGCQSASCPQMPWTWIPLLPPPTQQTDERKEARDPGFLQITVSLKGTS